MRFKATEIVTLVVALIAVAGTALNAFYTYANRNRELDIELVKIGISILRADPKETQTRGAREWAVDVVEAYSKQPFSQKARDQLLDNKLVLGAEWGKFIWGQKGMKFIEPQDWISSEQIDAYNACKKSGGTDCIDKLFNLH